MMTEELEVLNGLRFGKAFERRLLAAGTFFSRRLAAS
jgi:hypothetical protein